MKLAQIIRMMSEIKDAVPLLKDLDSRLTTQKSDILKNKIAIEEMVMRSELQGEVQTMRK